MMGAPDMNQQNMGQDQQNDDSAGNLAYASDGDDDGDKPRNRRKPRVLFSQAQVYIALGKSCVKIVGISESTEIKKNHY